MKDFFISYNRHDRAWAEWIAWMLEEAGYTTVIQAWDFRAGGNFVLDMQKAASEAQRTIAVLSETYLASNTDLNRVQVTWSSCRGLALPNPYQSSALISIPFGISSRHPNGQRRLPKTQQARRNC